MSDSADVAFTVVIPAYQAERFLPEALASVAAQTMPAAFVVVVDDGSSDSTRATAERLLVEHGLPGLVIAQTNQGISAARNAGLASRRTDWVALLDADDLWLPNHLEALARAVRHCPDAVVAFGDSRFFGDPRSRTDLLARGPSLPLATSSPAPGIHRLPRDRVFDALLPGLFFPVSGTAFRMRHDGPEPRFQLGLRSGEDRYFFMQMSQRGDFVFADEQIARTRRHETNTTHHSNAARLHEDLVVLLTRIDRTDDFVLDDRQRAVVRAAASRAADLLMYSASRFGWRAYWRAQARVAPYLPLSRRLAPRDFARAVAVSVGLVRRGAVDRPGSPETPAT